MQTAYYKEYSRYLGREMEFKVYGHGGTAVLALPCRGGRFYDWENNGMTAAVAGLIEAGKLTLVCADSCDEESYLAQGEARARAAKAEQYFCYLTEELYPRILALTAAEAVAVTGTDLGAAHALRLWLRRPTLFRAVLALSGDYSAERYFGAVQDDLVLRAGCVELANAGLVPAGQANVTLCVGQGAWEEDAIASTRVIAGALSAADIAVNAEFWGSDVTHDWYWWGKQLATYADRLLG